MVLELTAVLDFSLSQLPTSPAAPQSPRGEPSLSVCESGETGGGLAEVGVFEEWRVLIDYNDIVTRGWPGPLYTLCTAWRLYRECWPVLSVYKYV